VLFVHIVYYHTVHPMRVLGYKQGHGANG